MKTRPKPWNGTGGGANNNTTQSIALNDVCPYASECRRVVCIPGTETAICKFCGQVLDRDELLALLLGPRR